MSGTLWEQTGLPLGEVLRQTAARLPDRVAMIGAARQWTWRELDEAVDQAALLFESCGIGPGDPVGFLLSKRPEVVIGFLACARMGALQTPINFKLPLESVRDLIRTAGVRALLSEPDLQDLAEQLRADVPGPLLTVDGSGPLDLSAMRAFAGQRSGFKATADTPCYLNYTSGSTGRPKGALTTHRNILVNAVATIEGLGFTEDDTYLGMFSVFAHPHELFHRSILLGGAFVVIDSLNPRIIAEVIARHRVRWMMAVPSFYEMLLEAQESRAHDHPAPPLTSLRVLESGGAYVSPDMLVRMERRFNAIFLPVWGSTETTGVAIGMRADQPRRPGSTGMAVPGYDLRICYEEGHPREGQEADTGDVGELFVRGGAVALGYIGQPAETAAHFRDGWYGTRDLMRRDADGYIWFTGRRSEMLKIGGIRVFPLEIEQVLLTHPAIRNAVVVRAEERLRGEVARAIIEPHPDGARPGPALTVRAVQAWCRERLALYMVPRIVEFWDDIPKLPNGKIDKKAILSRSIHAP